MSSQPSVIDERAGPEHGGPHPAWLYYGLLAPPAIWAYQFMLNYALASHACYPSGVARTSFLPGWGGIWWALLGINLACLLASAAGVFTSYIAWRRLLRPSASRRRDEHDDILEPGEGRVRVFAASGILVSLLFTVAILAGTESLGALSTCSQA